MNNRLVFKTPTALNDFQVFKGGCERTMKAFGSPVMARHEACLIVRDDQKKEAGTVRSLYAIHQRSENRIVEIFQAQNPKRSSLKLAA